MSNILITGGAGYIGSVMTSKLLELGNNVTVLDNLRFNQNSLHSVCYHPNFNFIRGDVRDRDTVSLATTDVEYIIPLAASVGAPLCDADPRYAREVNVDSIELPLNVMNKDQKILYPNTNSGYGVGNEDCCTENSPLTPVSLYGSTKVEAEKMILEVENCITFRLATVFGPSARMRTDLLVNNFTYKALKERVLVLFEQNFRRNYIHIQDVVGAFLHGMDNFHKMKGQAYNLGLSTANLTKKELALKIKNHVPEVEIISSEFGKDPDKRDYIVSNEKLERTGWRPKFDIDDGIRQLLTIYKMID